MQDSKQIKQTGTPPIPAIRPFLTGSAMYVQPSKAKGFCDSIVNSCLAAEIVGHCEFSLGFAACLDAIARGTIDLEDPIGTVKQAWADVNNIASSPNRVTDIMRIEE